MKESTQIRSTDNTKHNKYKHTSITFIGRQMHLIVAGTHTTGSNFTLPNTDYAHKTAQVISVKHVLILPEDGSQRIRNMSEFLIVF